MANQSLAWGLTDDVGHGKLKRAAVWMSTMVTGTQINVKSRIEASKLISTAMDKSMPFLKVQTDDKKEPKKRRQMLKNTQNFFGTFLMLCPVLIGTNGFRKRLEQFRWKNTSNSYTIFWGFLMLCPALIGARNLGQSVTHAKHELKKAYQKSYLIDKNLLCYGLTFNLLICTWANHHILKFMKNTFWKLELIAIKNRWISL